MPTEQILEANGHQVKITVTPDLNDSWQSKAEIDLGQTGCVVFENQGKTYSTAEEAREAALALATENLSRSRVGISKS